MSQLQLMGLHSDIDDKKYYAADIGQQEQHCPICGKEKYWRCIEILGAKRYFLIRCECEAEAEQKQKAEAEQRKWQELVDKYFGLFPIPKKLDADFSKWEHIPQLEQFYRTMKDYADNFTDKTETGLCIYGSYGNGKSTLAAAIAKQVYQQGHRVIYANSADLFQVIRDSYNGAGSEYEILQKVQNADLLILDDVGTEKTTEWVESKFYQIINNRYERNKPIILITNIGSMKDLTAYIGDRAYDRVVEMCYPVENKGGSYRRRIATERMRGA